MYRVHQIKLGLYESTQSIPHYIKKRFHLPGMRICQWKIVRESIDARNKSNIKRVFTVDFSCDQRLNCPTAPDESYLPPHLHRTHAVRPVIAGSGPCGLFCALILSRAGIPPVILERGKPVRERTEDVIRFRREGILDPDSNVQFGEGGAGTFSDGKLTTGIKDPRMHLVLETFAAAGGGEEILRKAHPHIGTDRLATVIPNIRKEIESLGGIFSFSSKMNDVEIEEGHVTAVRTEQGDRIETGDLVLAIGHSARDTFRMLLRHGVHMEQKPFSMGIRICHPQSLINRAQYGNNALAERLGAAEYKLSWHCRSGRGVYTFCMCPGGEVIVASSAPGQVVTNGMSNSRRDGAFANSGLLVDVRTDDFPDKHPLAGMWFQQRYEEKAFHAGGETYAPPVTTWGAFPHSAVAHCLPSFVVDSICEAMPHFGAKIKGFDDPRAKMIGVETRSSSPVRIRRDTHYMSSIKGIYPGGEGAGYAGGIVSAAVDGIKIAEAILRREE